MDIVFGLVIYVAMTWAFGQGFHLIGLAVVMFFAIAPDLDFIPFVLLRRRYKLVSHWIIHFPLLYIPIGTTLVWFVVGGEWFYMASFILGSLAHFLHDSRAVQGVQWLWPISKAGWALEGVRMIRVESNERKLIYDRLRKGAQKRSILDEIRLRIGKNRPKWLDR